MKKIIILSISLNVILVLGALYSVVPEISLAIGKRNKFEIRNAKKKYSYFSPFPNDTPFFRKYNIIAHGGGGIDGKVLTGSKESYELSYKRGLRIFDVDLNFSSDSCLICRHSFHDDLGQPLNKGKCIPTYIEFMNTPILGKYSPLDINGLLDFLYSHEDVYFCLDTKNDYNEIIEAFLAAVVSRYSESKEAMLDRIIISFSHPDDYFLIKEIYPFKNWEVKQYHGYTWNYYDLASFCMKYNIRLVAIWSDFLDEGDDISPLVNAGVKIYAAIINSPFDMSKYYNIGIKGFIGDFIYEEDFQYLYE